MPPVKSCAEFAVELLVDLEQRISTARQRAEQESRCSSVPHLYISRALGIECDIAADRLRRALVYLGHDPDAGTCHHCGDAIPADDSTCMVSNQGIAHVRCHQGGR